MPAERELKVNKRPIQVINREFPTKRIRVPHVELANHSWEINGNTSIEFKGSVLLVVIIGHRSRNDAV